MTVKKFSFIDYLAAKKSVDDRALNQNVLKSLAGHLSVVNQKPLHVLEIAAGIGTMLQRLVEWQVLKNVVYTAIDLRPEYIAEAWRRVPRWAEKQGFSVQPKAGRTLVFERSHQRIELVLEAVDVFDFVEREQNSRRWDLLIAHAFWDLVDISSLLPTLLWLLKPAGCYYFTINFDGETILLPEIDPQLDARIIKRYHAAMDEQSVGGSSRSGRKLFAGLNSAGAKIIGAGSSDWVVFPGEEGYPADEVYFLHCIIDTIHATLQGKTPFDIAPWIAHRHNQISQNKLIYIAHQIDFFGAVNSRE